MRVRSLLATKCITDPSGMNVARWPQRDIELTLLLTFILVLGLWSPLQLALFL